jgi:hypothetical protein
MDGWMDGWMATMILIGDESLWCGCAAEFGEGVVGIL